MDRKSHALSPARRQYLKNVQNYKRRVLFCQIGVFVFLVAAWELLARWGIIDSFVFSMPSRIAATYANMAENRLLTHIGVTVFETLTGFLLGAVIGTVSAVILWWNPFIAKVSEPYLVVLNSLPKIALGPVIIIIAGAGTKAIIVMALAISLVVTVLEMLGGFLRTDPECIRMAETFGAKRRQIFFKIVLPYNIPTLFGSLKINIGLSLVGVIAGEFLVSKAGLGYLIVYGGQVFKLDLVMASVIILSAVAAIMYEAVNLLQKLVARRISHTN